MLLTPRLDDMGIEQYADVGHELPSDGVETDQRGETITGAVVRKLLHSTEEALNAHRGLNVLRLMRTPPAVYPWSTIHTPSPSVGSDPVVL